MVQKLERLVAKLDGLEGEMISLYVPIWRLNESLALGCQSQSQSHLLDRELVLLQPEKEG